MSPAKKRCVLGLGYVAFDAYGLAVSVTLRSARRSHTQLYSGTVCRNGFACSMLCKRKSPPGPPRVCPSFHAHRVAENFCGSTEVRSRAHTWLNATSPVGWPKTQKFFPSFSLNVRRSRACNFCASVSVYFGFAAPAPAPYVLHCSCSRDGSPSPSRD